MEDTKLRTTAR